MKPKIVIDARMAGMGGIGRYIESLVKAMVRERPEHRWVLVGDPGKLKEFAGVEIRECRVPIYSPAELWGTKRLFDDADLVHIPHFNAPASCRAKLVVTIHDLIHFDYPEYQPFPGANLFLDWRLKHLLEHARGVLAVSQATASALQARYPQLNLASKTWVTWEAAGDAFDPEQHADDADRLRRLGVTEPYFLYVGAIREHKATHELVAAFGALKNRQPGIAQLVLAGQVDPRFDRKHGFLKTLAGWTDIHLLKSASDQDLAALYRRTAAVVLPSRIEGFGLPLVEAMRSGAPLVVSGIPALKEIAGSAALFFEPGQIDALSQLLYNVLNDRALRPKLVQDGLERSRRFLWSETARQTLKAYDSILQSG